jgi:hypothetical protein
VRQLAIDTPGGLAQVECRLHFTMAEDLAGLSSFQQ